MTRREPKRMCVVCPRRMGVKNDDVKRSELWT